MGLIKSIWDVFGNAYDEMKESGDDTYENSRDCNDYDCNDRQVQSGWSGVYSQFVNGPIKIVHNGNRSEIQCFRPGMVYSGAEHSEYTQSARAISAYWSGDVLYAQLENGDICEWFSPGCPYEH